MNGNKQERYKRQLLLGEIGETGQQRLSEASVLIIGVGGLGAIVAAYLAGAGVGRIGLMDFDRVELSNLHRQVFYNTADLGAPKSTALQKHLARLNPDVNFEVFNRAFNRLTGKTIASGFDLLVDCTDQVEVRYEINDVAVFLGKPWVYGAVHAFEGQVSIFNFKNGPTYRCLFPEKKSAAIPSCEELGVMGPLPGIIGLYQAMEVMKIIAGFGQVLSGRLLIIDLKEPAHRLINFSRGKTASEIARRMMKNTGNRILELINTNEIEALLKNKPDTRVVDLRENPTPRLPFKNGINIPYYSFDKRFMELDKNQPVLLICEAGIKSRWASNLLAEKDFKEVYSLAGGFKNNPENAS